MIFASGFVCEEQSTKFSTVQSRNTCDLHHLKYIAHKPARMTSAERNGLWVFRTFYVLGTDSKMLLTIGAMNA